jgi:hypothetical protein
LVLTLAESTRIAQRQLSGNGHSKTRPTFVGAMRQKRVAAEAG